MFNDYKKYHIIRSIAESEFGKDNVHTLKDKYLGICKDGTTYYKNIVADAGQIETEERTQIMDRYEAIKSDYSNIINFAEPAKEEDLPLYISCDQVINLMQGKKIKLGKVVKTFKNTTQYVSYEDEPVSLDELLAEAVEEKFTATQFASNMLEVSGEKIGGLVALKDKALLEVLKQCDCDWNDAYVITVLLVNPKTILVGAAGAANTFLANMAHKYKLWYGTVM